jgi:hypothetical protein
MLPVSNMYRVRNMFTVCNMLSCFNSCTGGLETEKQYPYTGSNDKCSFNKSEARVDISGYLNISSNEDGMY